MVHKRFGKGVISLVLVLALLTSLLPAVGVAANAAGETHIATFVGGVPTQLAGDTSVTADMFAKPYDRVEVTSGGMKYIVEVVPKDLVYFLDLGIQNSDTTDAYTAVTALSGVSLKNNKADQEGNNTTWGHKTGTYKYKGLGTYGADATKKDTTGVYGADTKGQGLTYYLPLEAGTYTLTSHHFDWWGNTGRPITLEVKSGTTVLASESIPTGSKVNDTKELTFTLDADGTVEYVLTAGANQGALISWLGVVKEDTTKAVSVQDAFVATYTGEAPKLPTTVKGVNILGEEIGDVNVTWDTTDIFDTPYSTVTVNGTATLEGSKTFPVKAHVEVVPKNLVYFIDGGLKEGDPTGPFDSIKTLVTSLKNDVPDQTYVENGWGYKFSRAVAPDPKGTDQTTVLDKGYTSNHMKGNSQTGDYIDYVFPLEAGRYKILSYHMLYWSNNTMPIKTSVLYGPAESQTTVNGEEFSIETENGSKQTNGIEFTLSQKENVTYRMTYVGQGDSNGKNKSPYVSWVAVEKLTTPIDGTVAISGDAKIGSELTADASGVTPAGATLTYAWHYGDNTGTTLGTEATYTPTKDDWNKTIAVTVTGSGDYTGSLTSAPTAAVVKAPQEAPTGLGSKACTTADNNNGTITGVSTDMEYKLSTDETWTKCTGNEITGLAPGTYQVRKAATDVLDAGGYATVTVAGYNAPEKAEKPTGVAFNAANMTLTSVSEAMEYSLDVGVSWTPVAANADTVDLSKESLTVGSKIQVRVKATDTASASDPVIITLTQAEAPTGLSGVTPTTAANSDGKITGVATSMEYKLDSATTWTKCTDTEITGLTPGTYEVRTSASGTALASQPVEVAVPKFNIPTEYHIATYVGEVPKVDGVTWDADVTADKFSTAFDTVSITGKATYDDTSITARVEVVPKGLAYFIDCGTGPDWKAIMQASSNSTDKGNAHTLASGAYAAVKDLVGAGLLNGESDQKYDKTTGKSWGFLNEMGSERPNVLQTYPNENNAAGYTDGAVIGDKYEVGLRANTDDNFAYVLELKAGTYTLTTGYREFYNKNSSHTRIMTPTITNADTEAKIATLDTVTMSFTPGSNAPDVKGLGTFTLAEDATVKIQFVKGSKGDKGSLNWLAVYKGKAEVEPNTCIPGTTGGNWHDTEGKHIQAHGGQVQWLDSLDLNGDGTAEGGWIWYGEDKTGSEVRGVRCYTSPDLYNWTDQGTALYVHDLLPAKIQGDGVALDGDALDKLKGWAEMNDPTAEVTQEQINMAKAFIEPYKNKDGSYDETSLELAFWNLFSGYCIVERPKMLYNESTKQYVMFYHNDGCSDAAVKKYIETDGATRESRYARASMGFAVSDTPYGPFKLVNVTRMNYVDGNYDSSKGMARDMNVFIDEGKDVDKNGVPDAYAIYSSEENKYMYVSLLNASYTGPATQGNVDTMTLDDGTSIKTFAARVLGTDQTAREAPAVFTYGGYYYMLTSGTTGWSPNQARYHRADNIMGPYTAMGDPCVGDTNKTTFASQPTCVIPYDAEQGKFIYMGDRWIEGALTTSSYVWMPIELKSDGTLAINGYHDWTPDLLDKLAPVRVITKLPKTVMLGDDVILPSELKVGIGNNEIDTAVTWNANELAAAKKQIGVYTVTGTLADGGAAGRTVNTTVTVVPKDVIYFVDCGTSEPTELFKAAVEGSRDTMVNKTVTDQAYTKGSWGYQGNPEARSATDPNPFITMRYVAESATGSSISYVFPLEAGTYDVTVGFFDPWYQYSKGSRVANVSLTLGETAVGTTQSHTISEYYDTVTFTGVDVNDPAELKLLLAPKNTGKDSNVQVSWITVTGHMDNVYKVSYELTNAEVSEGSPATVRKDKALEATLTAPEGFTLPETITVTMGGTALEAGKGYTYDAKTGKVSIAAVTGDVVITAAAEKILVEITGELAIIGTAEPGQTVAANLIVEPNGATVSYAWYRLTGENEDPESGLKLGTGTSYTITKDDIGKFLAVTAAGTGDYAGTIRSDTVMVTKISQAAPTGVSSEACTTAANDDGKITGVTAAMEYKDKNDNDTAWKPCAGTEVTGLSAGIYQVRMAGTDTLDASDPIEVEVLAYNAPAKAEKPTGVTFDAADMTLSGVDDTMEYALSGNEQWTAVEAGAATVDLSGEGLTDGSTIQVRVKAKANVNSASDPVIIVLSQAGAPTGLTGVAPTANANDNGKITGLESGKSYEYTTDGNSWTDLTAGTKLTPNVYSVRVKGSGTVLPSEAVAVTVPEYTGPEVPAVTGVTLDKASATIYVNGSPRTVQLTASVVPETAANKEVTWSSSNEKVAAVNENGLVTAVGVGEAVITVTTAENSFTADCAVTVRASEPAPGPSGGGSGVGGSTTTTTETNEDGSVTTTVTDNNTGTVTENTKYPDGSTVEKITEKDGTVTETSAGADGTVAKTVTKPDGSVNKTVTEPTGKQVETVSAPDKGLTITVKAPKGEMVVKVDIPVKIPAPTHQFIDIGKDHWAKKAVDTVAGLGLFQGTSENVFSDKAEMTRGMMVTVLHRLSGEVELGSNVFDDVENEKWYTEAVSWASANNIVEGIGEGKYAPQRNISRQELTTILYRYAKLLGLDTEADRDGMNAFPDAAQVSGWAAESMAWAVDTGLVNGRDGSLVPNGSATRAEVAAVLDRFVKLLSK